MNILSFFSQSYIYETQDYNTLSGAETAGLAAFVIGIYLFAFLINVAVYVVTSLALMKIFAKAGVKPWVAWVPFYNMWKLLEIGGQPGWWAILLVVPVVQIAALVFMFIAMYHIGKKLGKEGVFILLGIFLPIVWYIWLGYDKSVWNENGSNAPSLHHA